MSTHQLQTHTCKKMPKKIPFPNWHGFTEVFLTGFQAAVPGSAAEAMAATVSLARSVWQNGDKAGRAGRAPRAGPVPWLGAVPGKSGAALWGSRSARLGSARPQARKRLQMGSQGPRSSNQGRKHQVQEACR